MNPGKENRNSSFNTGFFNCNSNAYISRFNEASEYVPPSPRDRDYRENYGASFLSSRATQRAPTSSISTSHLKNADVLDDSYDDIQVNPAYDLVMSKHRAPSAPVWPPRASPQHIASAKAKQDPPSDNLKTQLELRVFTPASPVVPPRTPVVSASSPVPVSIPRRLSLYTRRRAPVTKPQSTVEAKVPVLACASPVRSPGSPPAAIASPASATKSAASPAATSTAASAPASASPPADTLLASIKAAVPTIAMPDRGLAAEMRDAAHEDQCAPDDAPPAWSAVGTGVAVLHEAVFGAHFHSVSVLPVYLDGSTAARPPTLAQRKAFRAFLRARLAGPGPDSPLSSRCPCVPSHPQSLLLRPAPSDDSAPTPAVGCSLAYPVHAAVAGQFAASARSPLTHAAPQQVDALIETPPPMGLLFFFSAQPHHHAMAQPHSSSHPHSSPPLMLFLDMHSIALTQTHTQAQAGSGTQGSRPPPLAHLPAPLLAWVVLTHTLNSILAANSISRSTPSAAVAPAAPLAVVSPDMPSLCSLVADLTAPFAALAYQYRRILAPAPVASPLQPPPLPVAESPSVGALLDPLLAAWLIDPEATPAPNAPVTATSQQQFASLLSTHLPHDPVLMPAVTAPVVSALSQASRVPLANSAPLFAACPSTRQPPPLAPPDSAAAPSPPPSLLALPVAVQQLLTDVAVLPLLWPLIAHGPARMQAQTRSLGSSVVVPVVSSSSSSSSATQAPTLASLEQLSPYATAARLFRPLANMHRAGMRVCVDTATARRRELLARMQALETAATAAAQTPFLITSPEQVSHVLYTVLKLPRLANTTHGMAGQRRTTGAGQKFHSTSSEHLLRLSSLHAVPGLILQHRQAHKLVSTYVDPLLRAARVCGGAPCLHPRWHHTCTATGRMSSSHPNLQSMPKKTISLELASLSSPSPARCPSLRCMLVPAPGRTFLAADYRQVEVRMAAVLSGDAGLRAALAGGGDVYTGIAAQCFSILASEVSPWQREAAKGVALGTLYGMGPEALASRLKAAKQRAETAGVSAEAEAAPGDADMAADDDDDDASSASTLAVSPAEMQAARDLQQRFFASFPAVQAFLYQSVANAKQYGYIRTLSGRRRPLPHLRSRVQALHAYACRQAVNSEVQGGASDVMRAAMSAVASVFDMWNRAAIVSGDGDARVLEAAAAEVGVEAGVGAQCAHAGGPGQCPPHWHCGDVCMDTVLRLPTPGVAPPPRRHGCPLRLLGDVRLVAQLHDELVVEAPAEALAEVAGVVAYCMACSAPGAGVKFPVSMRVGSSWGNMAEVKANDTGLYGIQLP